MLPADAASQRDSSGMSALALCAVRTVCQPEADWAAVLTRLLASASHEFLTEIVDMDPFKDKNPNYPVFPCPVLQAALHLNDGALVSRCLTQPAIDAHSTWKERLRGGVSSYSVTRTSLVFEVAGCAASTLKEALLKGLRFAKTDTMEFHDGQTTGVGPVGAVALRAAECFDDDAEKRALCEVAALLLELGCDDPDNLMLINGTPSGFDALVGNAYYDGNLGEMFVNPCREALAKLGHPRA